MEHSLRVECWWSVRCQGRIIRLASCCRRTFAKAPLIRGGAAIASTFEPSSGTDTCQPPGGGKGYVYYLNLADATPVYNFNGIGENYNLTASDRRYGLAATGIPPQTTIIVNTDDNGNAITTILHGKEKGQDPTSNQPMKTFWFEQNK